MTTAAAHPNAVRLINRRLAAGIRPARRVRFRDWLADNIVLVDGPKAGQLWDPAGAPYLLEPADCLEDDHPCNLVSIRKSQQTGASILAAAWCLYIADREPSNVLYAMPNLDALRDFNSQKLQPLIAAWQTQIRRTVILPQTSRNAQGSTTYEKKFAGGYIALANANSVMELSSKTVRKGIKDEVSKWQEIPGAQDPEDLFFGRFTAFRRTKDFKILEISTPEVDSGVDFDEHGEILGDGPGHCRIDRSFQRSDRRFWHCQCPECGEAFVHSDENLQVDERHPQRSRYRHDCGHLLSEAERAVAVRAGHWRPTIAGAARHPGFHIDAFVSLMMSYEAIAEDRLKAQHGGELAKKGFSNLVLALAYKFRGDAPDWKKLLDRVERDLKRGHVPPRGLLLVAFADVQMRGIWLSVRAFAPNRESWSVDALYIEGDTSDHAGPVFQQLRRETLERRFPDAFGAERTIDALGVDSGYRANVVYAFVRNAQRQHPMSGRDMVLATKGLKGWSRPPLGQPSLVDIDLDGRKVAQGAKVWGVGTWPLKVTLYADIRQVVPEPPALPVVPDGYWHFGAWNDEQYFRQLTAERLEDIKFQGRTTGRRWTKTGDNHFHDCEVGNIALADYLGLSSTSPEQWAQLAIARGLPPAMTEIDLFTPRAAAPVHDAADAKVRIAAVEAAAKKDPNAVRPQRAPAQHAAFRDRTSGWWGRRR